MSNKTIDKVWIDESEAFKDGTEAHEAAVRYVGRSPELVFSTPPTGEQLEQTEGWADRIQQMSGPHKIIYVDMGPQGNRQLEELVQYLYVDQTRGDVLGPLTADEFRRYRVYSEKEICPWVRKGKGQRKANRRERWR